jgi:hypothetical protein
MRLAHRRRRAVAEQPGTQFADIRGQDMGTPRHRVRNEPWGTIDLDLVMGHVFVRQDWRYEWSSSPDVSPWTEEEKRTYHHAVDRLIWTHWSMHARIMTKNRGSEMTGGVTGDLAAHFAHRGLTLSFDVRSVPAHEQWIAAVQKVDPAKKPLPQAKCNFELRRLQLYNIDVTPLVAKRFRGRDPRAQKNFYVAPHEFGHAIGYGYSKGKGEEYEAGHRHYSDVRSIMNIGRQVRARHLFLIVETLGSMVPGCSFSARVER